RKSLTIQLEAYKQLGLEDAVARTEKLIELNPVK
ncbi:outer membrane protein assembly factor BamD, partial [Vibrio parahaemolyticus]|nr:outer membrane protein assembly factor BamD [Vibrio parahaemolyticus]